MQPQFSQKKEVLSLRSGHFKFPSIILAFFLVWLTIRFFLPLFSPFLLGALLALAAEPMTTFLQKKLRVPRFLSSGLGVCFAVSLLGMALLCLCAFLIRELGNLTHVLPGLAQTTKNSFSLVRGWLLQLSSHSPEGLRPFLEQNVNAFFSDGTALLDRVISYLLSLAGNLLSHLPNSALGLGTAVISAFLISAKLPRIRRWFLRQIPRERLDAMIRTGKQIRGVLGAWLTAQCKLTGVSFVLLFLGLVILRIPYALLWALGICLVDAFPVLGVGTVLLPWSLVCLLQQDVPRAIGLASTYAAVTLTRSMLEPRFLGRHLGLDPLVTLMALYIGFRLWGIGGMILAPVLTVIVLQITHPQPADH